MKPIDLTNVQERREGDFERLPAGGYVCRITAVKDNAEKERLELEYDIAEGKYLGYHSETYARAGFWGGRFIRSYSDKAQGFFKGFLTAVEQSNPGFAWNWDEKTLSGKLLGIVVGEREYVARDGSVKVGQEVTMVRSVKAIKEGDFKVPELRKLTDAQRPAIHVSAPAPAAAGFTEITDEDLPF